MNSHHFRSSFYFFCGALAAACTGCSSVAGDVGSGTPPANSSSGRSSSGSTGASGATTGGPGTTGTGTGNSATGATTGSGGGSGGTGSGGTSDGGTATGASPDAGAIVRDAGAIADANVKPDGPLPVCNYPLWAPGTAYKVGDIVMYLGKAYIALFDNPGLDPTISTFYWAPYTGCTPPPPAKCPFLDALLPNGETTFLALFTPTTQSWVPLAAYSYTNLCNALSVPSLVGSPFARSGNAVRDKGEIAGFFANVAIETAYLTFVDEAGFAATALDFHGRGALQITGQAIYQEVGAGLGLGLVANPPLASQPPVVWETGIWYWTFHSNPSVGAISHNAIVAGNFGQTILIIKGDCTTAPTRVAQYLKNCTILGITPGSTACP